MAIGPFTNPFRPGAGHMPPYLAGRQSETDEFHRLLKQDVILENMVLTGLRGVGKTVLLDTFKPLAIEHGWWWVGADLSESTSISEERLALRLMTDLAVVSSSVVVGTRKVSGMGFRPERRHVSRKLDFETMTEVYRQTPGLVSDKLKAVLRLCWTCMRREQNRGVVFAYDEAQNLSDHALKAEYPLSLMLDVFQSIQKSGIPFMLILAGLPTLFAKLVEARTFAERMFRVVFLDCLRKKDCCDAILKPVQDIETPVVMDGMMVRRITKESGGYPYFIQFICREIFDAMLQAIAAGKKSGAIRLAGIIRKLDTDFFAGRWARATDRQRELLRVIATLETCERDFTVQEIAEKSRKMLDRPFGPSQVNQMLAALCTIGLVYKSRHGRYSFAIPLLSRFILRQQ